MNFLNLKSNTSLIFLLALFLMAGCKKENIIIQTKEVIDVNQISAKCFGQVSENESIIEKGFCWDTLNNPTVEDQKKIIYSSSSSYNGLVHPLKPNTPYFIRAYATTESTVYYGNTIQITTLNDLFVDPRDGRNYKMITIGRQTWMAENLHATKYNDGTDIPLVENSNVWDYIETPGYCWYENDETTYGDTYGTLYNWYAVNTGKLCPVGWHVASDLEWNSLSSRYGGNALSGSFLKETNSENWLFPNDANNESGFSALPGGWRDYTGYYLGSTGVGYWWTSTDGGSYQAWYRYLFHDSSQLFRENENKQKGFSVRCIKDEN